MISFAGFRPRTFASKLSVLSGATFAILLLIALTTLYFVTYAILDKRMDEDLIEDVEEFALLHQNEGLTKVKQEMDREVMLGETDSVFLRLLDIEGRTIYSTDLSSWHEVNSNHQIPQQIIHSADKILVSEIYLNEKEANVKTAFGFIAPNIILHMGETTEEIDEIMHLLIIVFSLTFMIILPIISLSSWFLAKYVARGVEQVSLAATEIGQGNLRYRAEVSEQSEEIKTLADSFNTMAERISTLIAEMREMTNNIAHDLRSPIGRIRAIAETSMLTKLTKNSEQNFDTVTADILEECDRLIEMINTTLDVAEAETGIANRIKDKVDLSQLAGEVGEIFEPVAEQQQIKMSFQLEKNCWVQGNLHFLQRTLANLLDNALKFTPPQGEIKVALYRSQKNIHFSISDTGIGIPESEQHRIFERFYRCDQSRSKNGSGLGLSFVKAVVKAHQGKVILESKPGKGSTFTIMTPVLG